MSEQTPESQIDAALVETELHRAVDALTAAVGTLADLLRRPDALMAVAKTLDTRATYGRLETASTRLDAVVAIIDQVGGTVAGLDDFDERVRAVAMAPASPRGSVLDAIDFGDDDRPRQGKTWTEADSL